MQNLWKTSFSVKEVWSMQNMLQRTCVQGRNTRRQEGKLVEFSKGGI